MNLVKENEGVDIHDHTAVKLGNCNSYDRCQDLTLIDECRLY